MRSCLLISQGWAAPRVGFAQILQDAFSRRFQDHRQTGVRDEWNDPGGYRRMCLPSPTDYDPCRSTRSQEFSSYVLPGPPHGQIRAGRRMEAGLE